MSMARAIEIAAAAERRAYPKPTVGAVVVADGDVVADGVTEKDGRHAEVVALDAAGEAARGSTMFVTLEPCSHHGTTPPCTERIVAEGVARVVVGARDPNPEAAGGIERLREAARAPDTDESIDAEREEKRVNSARRAIAKAINTLRDT